MSELFKKNIKYTLIALGIFVALSLIYSYPALQGKVLNQHDNVSWKAMSTEARLHYEATGESPLWTNSEFGGMPTYTIYLVGTPQVIYDIQAFVQKILPKPAYFLFFAMLGFFILLSTLRVNRWIAVIGAIAYAFASYNLQIIAAGHETKMLSMGFMPIALAGMISLYRGNYILGSLMSLAGLAFTIQNGMYQIDYYLLIIMVLVSIGFFIKAIQTKKVKGFFISTGILIICGLLSVSMNFLGVKLTKEYGDFTMRGGQSELTITKKEKKETGGLDKDYAFSWSQSIGETFTLFVPNLYSSGPVKLSESSNTYETVERLAGAGAAEQLTQRASLYWGPQPFLSGPFYIGIITMLLMILGLFLIKNRLKWVLFAIGVFGIALSWGKHFEAFNYFLFDNLPMYNSFRTPNMSMVIPSLLFAVIAFWALHDFFSEKFSQEQLWDALKKSVIITAGFCILFGFAGSIFLDFKGPNDAQKKAQMVQAFGGNEQAGSEVFNAMVKDRSGVAMKDGLRSIAFILLAGLVLWLFTRSKLDKTKAIAAIGLLIVCDLLFIGLRYLNEDMNYIDEDIYESQFTPRPVDLQIQSDPDPYYRVLDFSPTDKLGNPRSVYNDAIQAIHHKCVGGYHPAKMESYQDLIDVHLSSNPMNDAVLDMLNTKYLIGSAQNNQLVAQPRPTACGNAWFVNEVKAVQSADEEMLAMNAANPNDSTGNAAGFNPLQTAVVRQSELDKNKVPISYVKDSSAQIKLTEYSLNYLNFESNNNTDGFAVFSDVYYPLGWKAYVNGKETPIVKTNYLLRGLFLPKGNNKIKFEFKPETYEKYRWTQAGSSYLILLLLLGLGFLAVKKEMRSTEKEGA